MARSTRRSTSWNTKDSFAASGRSPAPDVPQSSTRSRRRGDANSAPRLTTGRASPRRSMEFWSPSEMRFLRKLGHTLRAALRPRAADRELDAEFADHLASEIDDLIARG